MPFLSVDSQAPDFSLKDQFGNEVSLSSVKGTWAVIYFYPKDDTPGCTKEACNFRDNYGAIAATGARVLGVSADSAASHQKFAQKYELPFTLLVIGHEGRAVGAVGLGGVSADTGDEGEEGRDAEQKTHDSPRG